MRSLIGGLLAATLLLGGCSSEDRASDSADAPSESTQPSEATSEPESSATPEPEFAESDTCRKKMIPVHEIMMSNSADGLQFHRFEDRVDELERLIDRALLVCSDAMNRAARKVMYQFTLARVQWDLCNADRCMGPVTESIVKGILAADRIGELLLREL